MLEYATRQLKRLADSTVTVAVTCAAVFGGLSLAGMAPAGLLPCVIAGAVTGVIVSKAASLVGHKETPIFDGLLPKFDAPPKRPTQTEAEEIVTPKVPAKAKAAAGRSV